MIPLLMMIFQFNVKDSIAISNSIIACSALLRYLVNFKIPHPLKFDTFGKPAGTLVDYNLTLILVPSIIIGSAIGVIVNYILATPIQLAIQIICLIYMVVSSLHKLISMCRNERANIKKQ